MTQNRFILTPLALDQPVEAARRLASADWLVNDAAVAGDDQLARVAAIQRPLADAVERAIRAGERPVSVGGDCCQAIPVMAGLQRAGIHPTIVWLDAHGDFNTAETSPSGFLGGMPLAMLAGRGEQQLMGAVGARVVAESDVILADARDLDPGERAALERSDVRRSSDLSKVPRMIPQGRPVYVHFDPDLIDPVDAPALFYPVPGGPRASDVGMLLREIAQSAPIVAVSLTLGWDFAKDVDQHSENAALGALQALLR